MMIQINYGDVDSSDALTANVTETIETVLARFTDRITRVEVHLRDDKQKRRGPDDKRCTMEARPTGEKPIAVEAKAGDIYEAVKDCANKLQRAVTRKFERHDQR